MTIRISMGHIDEYNSQVATFAHQLGLNGVQLHTPNLLDESCRHLLLLRRCCYRRQTP